MEDAVAVVQRDFRSSGVCGVGMDVDRLGANVDEHVGQPGVADNHQRFVADVELAAALHVLVDLELFAGRGRAVEDEAPGQVGPSFGFRPHVSRQRPTGGHNAGRSGTNELAAILARNASTHLPLFLRGRGGRGLIASGLHGRAHVDGLAASFRFPWGTGRGAAGGLLSPQPLSIPPNNTAAADPVNTFRTFMDSSPGLRLVVPASPRAGPAFFPLTSPRTDVRRLMYLW